MNSHLHIGSSMGLILIATILLSACAPTPTSTPTLEPTATPVPTATSIPAISAPTPTATLALLSKPPELILAINKPFRPTGQRDHVVYNIPETDKVLLASELTYYNDLTVDIYYPPNYHFESKLPIVILAHGLSEKYGKRYAKDMTQHIDWAKLIAASGMIAVSAQTGDAPIPNSYHVLEFLAANADLLGIDLTRIGFWACSSQGQPVFDALEDKELPYRDAFRAAVFIYLDLASAIPSNWPEKLSLFVVRVGFDFDGPTVDRFVSQARSSGIPTEYIELPDAFHAFDVYENTQANKDVIRQALEFFKSTLLK